MILMWSDNEQYTLVHPSTVTDNGKFFIDCEGLLCSTWYSHYNGINFVYFASLCTIQATAKPSIACNNSIYFCADVLYTEEWTCIVDICLPAGVRKLSRISLQVLSQVSEVQRLENRITARSNRSIIMSQRAKKIVLILEPYDSQISIGNNEPVLSKCQYDDNYSNSTSHTNTVNNSSN